VAPGAIVSVATHSASALRRLIAVLKTKICDTPRARKNDAQLHIVTMIHCPGTATCRMHPM
jgi:hypothetical protein